MPLWIWAILLLVLGAGLAILEVFFASAGILAFLSAAAVVAAVVLGFQHGVVAGILISVGALAGLPTVVVLAFKYLPKTAMGRRLLLLAPKSEDVLPQDPEKEHFQALIGRTGRAKTKLLLSGVVTIDGHGVDAISESQPVDAGQAVRVVHVRGHCVVVRPVDESSLDATAPDPLKRTYDDPFAS